MNTITQTLAIVALPTDVAHGIRQSLRDGFGNQLRPQIDDGSAPCRHCLRIALPGEEVILFSYKPFAQPGLYQEIGPVFIHAHACRPYGRDDGFPPVFLKRPLVLRPYDNRNNICDAQVLVGSGEGADAADRMLANPQVAYVHARSASRGCFLFRIERGSKVQGD